MLIILALINTLYTNINANTLSLIELSWVTSLKPYEKGFFLAPKNGFCYGCKAKEP